MTTTKTYNLWQVFIEWIVNNNPSGVNAVLQSNRLITPGSNPSKAEMARALYNYYFSNSKAMLFTILKQIPVSSNTSEEQRQALANAYQEVLASNGGQSVARYQSFSRVADTSADKWWNDVIDVVLGSSETVVAPTVTTTTTTSPLVIGGLIAGVLLILGLAYFLIGKRVAA